jgi:hypothetical protein
MVQLADRTLKTYHPFVLAGNIQQSGLRPHPVRCRVRNLFLKKTQNNEKHSITLSPPEQNLPNNVRNIVGPLPNLPSLDQRQGTLYSGTWNYEPFLNIQNIYHGLLEPGSLERQFTYQTQQ